MGWVFAIDRCIKMEYIAIMNEERDPITEWEHAIGRRIGAAAVVCVLLAIVGAMVAPIFGFWIKSMLYRKYALFDDCEQRVKETMEPIWIGLWIIALLTWAIVIACNINPYG